ncbi:DUF5666 domain-containing protein, partial [Mycobacterium sp. E1319]|uniref:DUF5666 domain-containing protein n=1 Tax=Mycobacterium sp. E1319 TaxID=1834124 RepID=UPI001E34E8BD
MRRPQLDARRLQRPAANGSCPQPKQPPKPGTPGVSGTVASVTGNTITVNGSSPTTVTVTDKTRYTKQSAATTQAITQGKCLTAQGSIGGGGALQASRIELRPAHDGTCEGGPR